MTLSFQFIKGNRGSYGPSYRDITREGDTVQRRVYVGNRSPRVQIVGQRHFTSKSAARDFVARCESAQGKTIELEDRLNDTFDQVFLHAAAAEKPRAIAGNGDSWTVVVELEVQRTA